MEKTKIVKRDWDVSHPNKLKPIKKTSNYNKLIPEEKKIKKSSNVKEEKEIKLSDSDDIFLEELERKFKEAEAFAGDFNKDKLNKYTAENNILYERYIYNIKILEKMNLDNCVKFINIVFTKRQYKKFLRISNREDKRKYFEKIKERKIYNLVKKMDLLKKVLKLKNNSKDCIIDIKDLNKIYENKFKNYFVLKDVNVSIKRGDFVVLVGPSGSGKTTLMNIISGIDKLTFGEIIVDDINISNLTEYELTDFRLKHIGYIFQNYGLIPNLTVEENISMGAYMNFLARKTKKKMKYDNYINKQDVNKILESLSLEDIRDKMPYQLSGGQKQRVSIGRTLAKKNSIIFADEPTSALDEVNSKNIIDLLKKINTDFNTTIIMITHNDKEVDYATKVIRLKDGEIQ